MPVFAISSFIVSFLVMIGMIFLKLSEIKNGKQHFFFNEKSDQFLQKSYGNAKDFSRRWNWRTIQLLYHFILEKIENFFLDIYRYFRRKVDKPVNMVKGQGDLTVEKTDSSFFLKNIEEHKNNLNNK